MTRRLVNVPGVQLDPRDVARFTKIIHQHFLEECQAKHGVRPELPDFDAGSMTCETFTLAGTMHSVCYEASDPKAGATFTLEFSFVLSGAITKRTPQSILATYGLTRGERKDVGMFRCEECFSAE